MKSIPENCSRSFFAILSFVFLVPPVAVAAVTGRLSSNIQDPCSIATGYAEAPQCTPTLAQAYLNRCLVNYDGLKSVNVCNGGGCEGWSITARSVFLINKATRVYLNNTAACSTTELIRHGELNFVGYCVSPLGKLSYFRPGTANAGPIMAITKPANLPAQAQNTRISVRGISQGILYGQESNPYMYSLTLQDAVCTWYKYCDPNTQSLKAGVTPVGEINQSGSTTTFDANHPVRSLCRLKPNWYMGNAALNCAITQKGGLAKLCATPNPLDTTPQLGTP